MSAATPIPATSSAGEERVGFVLVFLAALCWSLGGVIARFIDADDSWTVVFWRSIWAASFMLGYMAWRDGVAGTMRLFANMGLPGLIVACCFAIATSSFVIALSYTTVANILLIQAGAPLFAALIAFLMLRERVSGPTWAAIAAVLVGVGVMVSDSVTGNVSAMGDGLALVIVLVFSIATVLTRRYAHVRMTPAMCLGTMIAGAFAATQASTLMVSGTDMGFLFAFGAINLGLGLAFFATGARMIPAAYAALLATFETLFGPVWVWLVHAEVPSTRTLLGGAIVFATLLVHIALQFRRLSRPARPGVSGISAPR
ncbi:DMT family transporter [Mesorhizobium sp. CAU 1741]|uniref:DMT family transporter n=1 Tax=Mesorhizobium sp. CAU 1741 TaxID=3140366 RepID=UPI00325AA6F0